MQGYLIKKIIGSKIASINRICDMVSVEFNSKENSTSYLHIQCFFRIKKGEKIVLSSEDMYRKGLKCKPEEFEWDIPGNSLFDESIAAFHNELISKTILDITISKTKDVIISLENQIVLEILIDTVSDEEKYRFFDENEEFVR